MGRGEWASEHVRGLQGVRGLPCRDDNAVLCQQLRVNRPRGEGAPESEKQALFLLLQPGSRGASPEDPASARGPPHWHSLPGRRSCPSARDTVRTQDAGHRHPQASGPLSPPLPERPLQYGGPGGAPPPRVRSRLLQDLLAPSPQTHVDLCDAPPRTKIQAGTLCCLRAPGTWPSWNLRPGKKVAQLRLEGSPSPGHSRQKEASLNCCDRGLAGLGASVARGYPSGMEGLWPRMGGSSFIQTLSYGFKMFVTHHSSFAHF